MRSPMRINSFLKKISGAAPAQPELHRLHLQLLVLQLLHLQLLLLS